MWGSVICSMIKTFPFPPPVFALRLRAVLQITHTLQVVQTMVDLYANETAVMGLQPVNEPWQFTPMDWLKVPAFLCSQIKTKQRQ